MIVDEPKKKSSAPLIILMFLIGIGLGFGANYGMSYFNIGVDKKESSTTEDTTKTDKLELTESAKAKMEMIVLNATRCAAGSANCDVTQKFFEDVSELDDNMKYTIVWNSIIHYSPLAGYIDSEIQEYSKLDTELTEEQFNLLSKDGEGNYGLAFIKKSHFDNIYRQLFNEVPKYSIKDINNIGCPSPVAIDETNDKIYYASECGGTAYAVSGSIKSFDIDGDNYLVHSEITESSADKEDVIYKVLWTFDKDLNFVSTVKE